MGKAPELAGGARGADAALAGTPREPWLIDVTIGGRECVVAGEVPIFWRPASRSDSELIVVALRSGQQAKLAWPADQPTIGWPTEIATEEGATYAIRLREPDVERKIDLRVIGSARVGGASPVTLVEAGCVSQALALASQIAARHIVTGTATRGGALFPNP